MNLTEAAVWLTENVTPEERSKPEEGGLNITGIDVSIGVQGGGLNITGIDVRGDQEGGTQYCRDRCK